MPVTGVGGVENQGKSWISEGNLHVKHQKHGKAMQCLKLEYYNSSSFEMMMVMMTHNDDNGVTHSWYLSQQPQLAVVSFFASRCPVLDRERKILANLVQFRFLVANIHNFWCTFTGLNNAVVSQNWQISVMTLASFTSKCQMPKCKERPRRSNPITNSSRW